MLFVPVVDKDQKPLMPTTPARAAKWIKSRKATPFWKKGVFCVRLNQEPSERNLQEIAIGVDPGTKKEGLTIKSDSHTYLNIQADAVTHVEKAKKEQYTSRRHRRCRKLPYRARRLNRSRGGLLPSSKARWQWKLRLIKWICKMFPVSHIVIEDIKSVSKKGCRRWNVAFSPIQVGKNWFYNEVKNIAILEKYRGYETAEIRKSLGLAKTKNKLSEVFEAHCVDSWVLANEIVGGHTKPDNTSIISVIPIKLHRRELHKRQPSHGGKRLRFGGTRSIGFKRGSIVFHKKHGIGYIGGCPGNRISIHDINTSKRKTLFARPEDIKFLSYCSWRTRCIK